MFLGRADGSIVRVHSSCIGGGLVVSVWFATNAEALRTASRLALPAAQLALYSCARNGLIEGSTTAIDVRAARAAATAYQRTSVELGERYGYS